LSAVNVHFPVLRDALTTGLPGAFAVAEACLRFATLSTRDGHAFDSANWLKELDVAQELCTLIPLHILAALDPLVLAAIADTIDRSNDQPLAAWVTAMRISTAISQNFAASDSNPSEYTPQDLQAFTIPPNGTSVLYGTKTALSLRPGPDFDQNNPSAVSGLALWRKEPAIHGPYTVVVDRTCGAQFDAAVGDGNTLKVALIQPNQGLMELCVTTLSPASSPAPLFFGVQPRDTQAQTNKVLDGLQLAASAGAAIALLPELVMTEAMVNQVVADLGAPGKIVPTNAGPQTLRVVVSGSYHHVEGQTQRNSTQVHFPRNNPMLHRQHSKSGTFVFRAPRSVMEMWSCDPNIQAGAGETYAAYPDEVDFREDVKATNEIRLFSGAKFSAVVVICADVLNRTFRRVLETLQPSLVLVCNMTPKQGDFSSAAHALILAGQSTLVGVNNPRYWKKPTTPVPGGMAGMPLQQQEDRVIEADVPPNKILIFDAGTQKLQPYP
jgi:hypothetical protein